MRKRSFCRLGIVLALTLCAAVLAFAACGDPADKGEGNGLDPGDNVTYEMEYGDILELAGSVTVENTDIARYDATGGLLTAVGVGKTAVTVDGATRKLTVSPAEIDVVLFTGQSNMVGKDTVRYDVDIPAGQAYEYKHTAADDKLVEVKNPSGEKFGGYTAGGNGFEDSSGSCMAPAYCAKYVALTGRKIVMVHVARAGKAISYFTPNGPSFGYLNEKYNACLDHLTESPNFKIGHKYYLMLQGESDARDTPKETYKARYMEFHNALKSELGTEFGAIIYTGTISTETDSEKSRNGVVKIAQAKSELAYENDDIIIADKSPLSFYYTDRAKYILGDRVHYTAAASQLVGDNSAINVANYLGYGDKSKKGVDPVTYLKDPTEPASIAADKTAVSLVAGDSVSVGCKLKGTGGMFTAGDSYQPVDVRVTWSTANPAVATVTGGRITAVGAGTTKITVASVAKPSVKAEITVTVI